MYSIPKCFPNILDTVLYVHYTCKTIRLLDYIVYTQKLYISYQCIYFLYINSKNMYPAVQPKVFPFYMHGTRDRTKEYWMIREGQPDAFSPSYDPVSKLYCISYSVFLCVAGRTYWRWRERAGATGWGWSQIIRYRESLVLYKSFNTLRIGDFFVLCFLFSDISLWPPAAGDQWEVQNMK